MSTEMSTEMDTSTLRFTKEHEWVKVENDSATVGITGHAVDELGEVVFVELPNIDDEVNQMDEFGSIESVKTVSSLYSPVSGKISEVNSDIVDNPGAINDSPYKDGWLVKIQLSNPSEVNELMTEADYKAFLESDQ